MIPLHSGGQKKSEIFNMSFETIFSLSSLPVIPLWLLMIVAPRWTVTKRIMTSPLSILAPALIYSALVLPSIVSILPSVMNPTLDGIMMLLATPAGATIAWVHFLAFDLFVGRWAYLDSRERGLSAWVMAPVLFFVLMLGPFGFVLYLIVQAIWGNSVQTVNGKA